MAGLLSVALSYLLWLALFLFGQRHPKVASPVLVRVARASAVSLGSHTKYIMLYQVFLNHQPLLFNILSRRSFDMMII